MPVRIALIGCGWIAEERLAPAVQQAPSAEVAGFVSRRREKAQQFCDRFGGRPFDRLDAALDADSVDAVFIATPNGQHCAEAIAAAEAGKHILCEKPMATSVAECGQMGRAAEKARVKFMVAYHMRYHPAHIEAKRLVDAGELGIIRYARAHLYFKYPAPPPEWRRHKATCGGWATGDVGTHVLDQLRWLIGDVKDVTALFDSRGFGYDTEDLALLALRFASGAIGTVDCSTSVHSPESKLEVYGSEGSIICTGTLGMDALGQMRITVGGQTRPFHFQPVNMYAAEVEAFAKACAGQTGIDIPAAEGMENVRILETVFAR